MFEKCSMLFEKIYPGIWRAHAGGPGDSLTAFYRYPAREEKLKAMPDCELPFSGGEAFWQHAGAHTVICLPRGLNENLYGLGLNFERINVTYEVRQLRSDHYGGTDNGRTHDPAPLYVSERGYAVLIDTPASVRFTMGGAVRKDAAHPPREVHRMREEENWSATTPAEYTEVSFEGNGCDIYVFAGEPGQACMRSAIAKVNLWSGGGFIPPKWGLGMWHRTHGKADAQTVYDEIAGFEAHNMPLSVIGLEPGWQSAAYPCSLDWDERYFADPAGFARVLHEKNIHLNLWENLYISKKSSIYDAILPHTGSHMVWNGVVPDLADEEAVHILSDRHEELARNGADGFKTDECDGFDSWLWPDHAGFPSGLPAVSMRSIYGAKLQRIQTDVFRKLNRRTYGLVRASNAGAAHMPYVIYNDCYTFSQFLTATGSAAFCGTLWVPEVRDAKTAKEWVRRFQLSAVSPMMMLNAWASGAKPWSFPEVEEEIRATLEFRDAFLPVLYNAFRAYYEDGIPPFRPLCMDVCGLGTSSEEGVLDGTENPYALAALHDTADEFFIGDNVIAAPVSPESDTREVLLPDGDWYNYFTFEKVPNRFTGEFALGEIPLFVRGGAVVPERKDGSLILRCYGKSGSGCIYDDDGESYDYENGIYALIRAEFENGTGSCAVEEHGYHPAYEKIEFRFA